MGAVGAVLWALTAGDELPRQPDADALIEEEPTEEATSVVVIEAEAELPTPNGAASGAPGTKAGSGTAAVPDEAVVPEEEEVVPEEEEVVPEEEEVVQRDKAAPAPAPPVRAEQVPPKRTETREQAAAKEAKSAVAEGTEPPDALAAAPTAAAAAIATPMTMEIPPKPTAKSTPPASALAVPAEAEESENASPELANPPLFASPSSLEALLQALASASSPASEDNNASTPIVSQGLAQPVPTSTQAPAAKAAQAPAPGTQTPAAKAAQAPAPGTLTAAANAARALPSPTVAAASSAPSSAAALSNAGAPPPAKQVSPAKALPAASTASAAKTSPPASTPTAAKALPPPKPQPVAQNLPPTPQKSPIPTPPSAAPQKSPLPTPPPPAATQKPPLTPQKSPLPTPPLPAATQKPPLTPQKSSAPTPPPPAPTQVPPATQQKPPTTPAVTAAAPPPAARTPRASATTPPAEKAQTPPATPAQATPANKTAGKTRTPLAKPTANVDAGDDKKEKKVAATPAPGAHGTAQPATFRFVRTDAPAEEKASVASNASPYIGDRNVTAPANTRAPTSVHRGLANGKSQDDALPVPDELDADRTGELATSTPAAPSPTPISGNSTVAGAKSGGGRASRDAAVPPSEPAAIARASSNSAAKPAALRLFLEPDYSTDPPPPPEKVEPQKKAPRKARKPVPPPLPVETKPPEQPLTALTVLTSPLTAKSPPTTPINGALAAQDDDGFWSGDGLADIGEGTAEMDSPEGADGQDIAHVIYKRDGTAWTEVSVLDSDVTKAETTAVSVRQTELGTWFVPLDDMLRSGWHIPDTERALGVSGRVVLEFVVQADGHINEIAMVDSNVPLSMQEAAIAAVPRAVAPPPNGYGGIRVRYVFRYGGGPG